MAGVNKFADRPAQAQFMNTYVPIPFQEMQEAVATRQARLDENLGRMNMANASAQNLNYISNSKDERYIKGEVQPGMENIVTEFSNQDLSDPTVYNALRAKMSSTLDKGRIKDIQGSHAAWQQNQEIVRKLKAQGKYQEALDLQDPAKDYDSRTGVYNYQSEAALDIRKAAEQYFNNLKADTRINPEKMEIWSGIGSAKIKGAAQENLRSFLDSKEGEQAVRIAAHRLNMPYDQLSTVDKEAMAMDVLMEVGDEFGYSSQTPMPGYASAMSNKQEDINPWISPSDATVVTQVADLKKIKVPSEGAGAKALITGSPTVGAPIASFEYNVTSEDIKVRQTKIDELKTQYPAMKDLSSEDVVDVWNTAINSVNNQSLGVKYISANVSNQIKGEITSGMNLRNFVIYDGYGVSTVGKLQGENGQEGEILEELGLSMTELKEAINAAPQLFITQDGPEAGMYGVEIKEKGRKGRTRTIFIGSNSNVQGMTNTSNQLNTRMRDLDETPLLLGRGESGKIVALRAANTLNIKDKTFNFEIQQGYVDDNGENFQSTGIYKTQLPNGMTVTGMDAVKQLELLQLSNSGVIGTNINYNNLPKIADKPFSLNP